MSHPSLKLLSICLLLSACTSATSPSGRLSLLVQRPQGFALSAIPAASRVLRIEVRGDGRSELSQDLPLTPERVNHSLSLSVGLKQVEVTALDAQGQALARAAQTVEIRPNQTTQAEIELTLLAVRPSPQPTPGSSGGAPTDPGPTGNPGGGGEPSTGPGTETSGPEPQSPAPQSSTPPVTGSTGGGSGGGGGGGSTTTGPAELTALIADPTSLPGTGYVSELKAVLNNGDAVAATQLSWSCLDNANNACPAPEPDASGKVAYWTAPATGSSPFNLTVRFQAVGGEQTRSVQISVTRANGGQVDTGTGEIDGSENSGV